MKSKIKTICKDPVNYLLLLTAIILAIGLGFILGNVSKGLDWTDEAWITTLLSTNQVTDGEPWGFQHVAQPIWQLFGASVVGARIARFVLYQLAVVIATYAIYTWAKSMGVKPIKQNLVIIGLSAEISMLLAWIYWPRNLGYTDLVAFFTTVCISAVLILISKVRTFGKLSRIQSWVFPISLGFLTALALLTKATSGAILAVGVLIVLLLLPVIRKVWILLLFVISTSASILLAWIIGFPISNYVHSIILMSTDANYASSFAHPPWLLDYAVSDLTSTAVSLVPEFLLALGGCAFIWGFAKKKDGRLFTNLGSFFFLVAAALVVWNVSKAEGVLGKVGTLGQAIGFIALSSILVYSWTRKPLDLEKWQSKLSVLIGGIAIGIAPLISSIGTNGKLSWHITFNEVIWGASFGLGISLLLIALQEFKIKRLFVVALVPLFALIVVKGQSVDSLAPYRITNYQLQTESLNSKKPVLSGLSVTPKTKSAMNWIEETGSDYSSWPVVSPASPGALLLFNNRSFASPWNEDFWPGSFDTIARKCQSDGIPKKLIVILPSSVAKGSGNYTLMENALLNGCGISFPNNFTYVGESPEDDNGIRYSVWKFQQ